MIQRKQTLFLFQLVFLGIALLFIPSNSILKKEGVIHVSLIFFSDTSASSTLGHYAAIAFNFIALLLAFSTIFLYKRRELQVKLCYLLFTLWLIITAMVAFCPFVQSIDESIVIKTNYAVCIIGLFSMLACILAIRFIKKDIGLLKSADRIR
jgi:hypothetical protein